MSVWRAVAGVVNGNVVPELDIDLFDNCCMCEHFVSKPGSSSLDCIWHPILFRYEYIGHNIHLSVFSFWSIELYSMFTLLTIWLNLFFFVKFWFYQHFFCSLSPVSPHVTLIWCPLPTHCHHPPLLSLPLGPWQTSICWGCREESSWTQCDVHRDQRQGWL